MRRTAATCPVPAKSASGSLSSLSVEDSSEPIESPKVHTKKDKVTTKASPASWAGLLLVVAITAYAVRFLSIDAGPRDQSVKASSLGSAKSVSDVWSIVTSHESQRVIWYGWITAASTGLGALPFVRTGTSLSPRAMAMCNAFAGGMMIAASLLLFHEGASHEAHAPEQAAARRTAEADLHRGGLMQVLGAVETGLTSVSPFTRAIGGLVLGWCFIMASKRILDRYEHLKISGFEGGDARRIVLVVGVMLLHSFTEGIGLGVSFGSEHDGFGALISATLAIHNVPEGLAVALVLTGKGTHVVDAALWAVITSLPQPLCALPAFLEVTHFLPVLPVGLGLAAGAMSYVAVAELLSEASEELGKRGTAAVALPAAALMAASHHLFR